MSGTPAGQIGAPVLGQVQLAVDEAMTQLGDQGQEDTGLTVFHTPGAPAILGGHTSGVAAAFGEAGLINDKDWEGGLSSRSLWQDRGRTERLADHRPQIIADPVLVPDGMRAQTLHA